MAAPLGFKTFNTGDVLTAADTNGYLMQGVWTFADATARTAAVTSPQEGNVSYLKDTNSFEIYDGSAWVAYGAGDITGVTATSPLTGGGTSGTVTVGIQDGTTAQKGAVQLEDSTSSTSTTKAATPNSVKSAYDLANGAIAKTLVDAKGDLIVASGADAVARLAVGTDNYVLTADSTATNGIKWAAASAGGDSTAVSLFKNKSISNATSTAIDWDTEYYDSSSFWSSGSTITIPSNGKYFIVVTMRYPSSSTGHRSIVLKQNGTNQWLDGDFNMSDGGNYQGQIMTYARGMSCTANDTIVLETYQSSGGSLTGDFTITILKLGA